MRKTKIYNKVKSLALVTLLSPLTALMFTGCGDFLEIEPQDKIVLEKYWNDKKDVDNVLLGCYSAMQTSNVLDRIMVWGEFRSDNIEKGTNVTSDVSMQRLLNENIDATNSYTTWDGLYDVINRLNTVLLYAPGVSAKDPAYSETMLKATIAEAKALRALCYFYLIRTFRDVPFVTEAYTDDSKKMDIPATPFYEVLDYLINDLEGVQGDAMITYPLTQQLYRTGRITQQAIHALLCEMYLWKQDYRSCVKYADLVLQRDSLDYAERYEGKTLDTEKRLFGYPLELSRSRSSEYYGMEYYNIFGYPTRTVSTYTSWEIIFELVFMQNDNMLQNESANRFYACGPQSNADRGIVAPAEWLAWKSSGNKSVYNKYDARLYENILNTGSDTYGVGKYVVSDITISANETSDNISGSYEKQDKGHNHANWIVYRLSDIMLMKAEALVELGTDGSAEMKLADTLVVAVHNRAYLGEAINGVAKNSNVKLFAEAKLTKAAMREKVLQERQRELMFEGKRWYDLVRRSLRDGNTDVLSDAIDMKEMDGAGAAKQRLKKMDAIFWPYNQEEMRVNHSLVQNPAFSSGENTSFSNTSN
jgi:hypothetical protein